ncbi:hypothetical protein RM549_10695 [Salegentibacter sp. F188]|uniref:DUF3575 domain-containing protein n=1 Tax=Autumnicola patrickiae TaxID=3075591 RepID=A0ABU3E3I2_9FLAO|nr:hypothetical protein [Salegentibacter sp. F188]MDT0690254.1 hypothetical protein [Salegentibacter sp. F188]
MKNYLLFLIAFTACFSGFSQERPMRIGIKLGLPNIVGLNAEYVTPWLDGRLAPNVDLSIFPVTESMFDDREGTISYVQAGFNYYLLAPGKGLYTNLSYGYLKGKGTAENVTAESPTATGEYLEGKGYFDESSHSINIKLGGKFGNKFYFRPEIGCAFNDLPEKYGTEVRFQDGSSEVQYESIPEIFTKGILFNIGVGIAF